MRHRRHSRRAAGDSSHFVYIVTCSDGALYTGYTADPARRLREHNSGIASRFTRGRLPVRLAFLEKASSRGAALRREHQIKTLNRREKMLLCEGFSKEAASSSR